MSEESSQSRKGKDRSGNARTSLPNDALMRLIDRYQARGNMLAQFGSVLSEEEQESAKDEVLSYKF